jgi:hypothetical protein
LKEKTIGEGIITNKTLKNFNKTTVQANQYGCSLLTMSAYFFSSYHYVDYVPSYIDKAIAIEMN